MQSLSYPVKSGASEVVSTANGTFYTDAMTDGFANCQVYVEFFSDAAGTTPATATAGTVTISGSPLGNIYLAPSTGTAINAADVSAGTYTPAKMLGLVCKGKVVFAGVTGAAYAKVVFWRY